MTGLDIDISTCADNNGVCTPLPPCGEDENCADILKGNLYFFCTSVIKYRRKKILKERRYHVFFKE